LPYINSAIADAFDATLQEINAAVPGGISFTEVFRTPARQQRLINNAANNNNPVAPLGQSRHQSGFAFDVHGIGTVGALTDLGRTVIPIFERHGFTWGGNFAPRNDPPHFEMDPTRYGYASYEEASDRANDYYEQCIMRNRR
jgi:hypothetical protein